MKRPGSTVRSRLTIAVALLVGALAVTSAMLAPRLVRNALVDDLLDAESVVVAGDGNVPVVIDVHPDVPEAIGTPELTALFGPEIAELTAALDGTGAIDRLRSFRSDGRLLVSSVPGTIGVVSGDGRVVVEWRGDEPLGPMVSRLQLQRLASGLDPRPPYADLFDLARDPATIDQLIEQLDGLDVSVFGTLPPTFDPEELTAELEELFDTPGDAADSATDLRSADDYSFGVRQVDGVEMIVAAPNDGVARTVTRLRDALWITVPVAMLLAGLVTWLLAGRALRPVRAITERTATIRSGTLHERVPVPGADDEISQLATVMNGMLDRLQRDDERRRQFVSDASHELRSPLAAIRTQAEAALVDDDSAEQRHHELATGVLAEAERMSTIVGDLLALARHDEGFAPPGIVLDLDDSVLTEARRPRRVPIDTSRVSGGRIRGRPDEITSVIAHLLDNAARHANSRVQVALSADHEHVRLTIDDDGRGVPVDQRERVFERFVRLDEARDRDRGGAGLGLAVVASVVRACGGKVEVDDSDLGGARFVIELPTAA